MSKRIEILTGIQEKLHTWDQTAQSAHVIIADTKEFILALKEMQPGAYSKEEILLIETIINQQERLITCIKEEKSKLATEIRAMNKKDTLLDSYLYPKRQPVFLNQQV